MYLFHLTTLAAALLTAAMACRRRA